MVILLLKQMWMVLSLNQHAQTVVSEKEPTQETGTGQGCLSVAVLPAKCETTARGAASGFKDQGVFMPPCLEAKIMYLWQSNLFSVEEFYLCFISLRKMEFQFLELLTGI